MSLPHLKHRAQAYGGLLAHYRAVFAAHWARRNDRSLGLFNEDEAEFLPAALALQERPVSSTARWTARVLMTLVAAVLAWSILGKIDIVVNATGKVIASGRTKSIASVDVASVHALHVVEGQFVKAGEPLLELDTSATDAERDKASGDAVVATLQAARSRALIRGVDTLSVPQLPALDHVPPEQRRAEQSHLEGQYKDFRTKLDRIDGDIHRFGQALALAAQQASDYKELSRNHDVSEHAYLDKERARVELQGQLADARNQRSALIAQTKKDALDALTEGGRIESGARQDAVRADSHSKLLKLTAPVDGTVQQLTVHTVGGVVPAAQPLMLIVPQQDSVEVEAFLENKDIGFVREGQDAQVKVDAFDYTKYGTLSGKVTHVSHDAIEDEKQQDEKKRLIYSAKVLLGASTLEVDGKPATLSPGMSVNVEVKTGTRRVIEYVLSPLLQEVHESLRER
ncbi:HlyD family type I secretion periplasmic adaptor subunit [Variovorax sp. 2RAF20]|uniref:HlyD family type I secretion periplasmic adaptor subunit n=1 Tax=Variovorax sp. CF313 TaxID=1144315 RepID=UPI000271025E|nr:HlyD family type I secretion periplasmic adaptor subunit [Variovorax sp. CF313]EJL76625.1 type I secretion membrane fusion protein, HlyD family [Variovorax sp. CF313]